MLRDCGTVQIPRKDVTSQNFIHSECFVLSVQSKTVKIKMHKNINALLFYKCVKLGFSYWGGGGTENRVLRTIFRLERKERKLVGERCIMGSLIICTIRKILFG